jgi:ankyrin repeat protein
LVNAGTDLTIVDREYSRTPLHTAVCCRRFCHVRKLVQLGAPINTEDFREESPLITALKMNNTEIVKFLLSSGATYQSAFSPKFNLSKTQQKPVQNYQTALQEAMKKARHSVLV